MADNIEKSRFIVIQWRESDIKPREESKLKAFLIANSAEKNPIIKYSPDKTLALVECKEARSSLALKTRLERPDFWTIENIYAVEQTRLIKVENMPPGTESNQICRYFTNKTNVNKMDLKDVKVLDKYFEQQNGVCVVQLQNPQDVLKVCEKSSSFKKFRDERQFKITPFYHDIDPLVLSVNPITIDNIDAIKLEYLQEHRQDIVNKKLSEICAKVQWADLKKGFKRVTIEFECSHGNDQRKHSDTWKKSAGPMFEKLLDDVNIVRKPLTADVWTQARNIADTADESVWVTIHDGKHLIILVAFKDDEQLQDLERKIDAIERPKPIITKEIKNLDTSKVAAFRDLSLTDFIDSVDVTIKTKSIVLRGDESSVKDAETKVLEYLNQIVFNDSDLRSSDHASILVSQQLQDKIKAIKEDNGWRCGCTITGQQLRIFAINVDDSRSFAQAIKACVVNYKTSYKGEVASKSVLKDNLKTLEAEYSPFVKLSIEFNEKVVVIEITCAVNYEDVLEEELSTHIDAYLIRDEVVFIAPSIVEYIKEKSIDDLKKSVANLKLQTGLMEEGDYKLKVKGNLNDRKQIIEKIKEHSRKIHAHWMALEREGVHDYLMDGKGTDFIRKIHESRSCFIRMCTQYEMKETNISCMVPLETGQALFLGRCDITNPTFPVDAIVNAANAELNHKGGLALAIVKKGGSSIQRDCNEYIQTLEGNKMEVGEVYVGTRGRLHCQRLIHAVGPEWKGGQANEPQLMEKLLNNILKSMDTEQNYILRSVAMPLISTGVFGFPKRKAAKIVLQTMKEQLKKYPNVREVYIYDNDNATVRVIQEQMQDLFGDKCFHLPVRDVKVGQGTIRLGKSQVFKLKRTGSRTLPLPRKKELIVQWGNIGETRADVVVCPTPDAPSPTGNVVQVLDNKAGQGTNLVVTCRRQFEIDFKNQPIVDGCLVKTNTTGRLPCSSIYFVKITQDPRKYKEFNESVTTCVKKCLERAVMQKITDIAFPTFGNHADLAKIFFRTVIKFVNEHPTCSLEKISINIHPTDMLLTAAFEGVMEDMYSRRTHRLLADIEDVEDTDGNMGEEKAHEKEKEKPKQPRPPSPIRRQPTVVITPPSKPAQKNMSYNIGGSSKYTVDLETANIEQAGTDAIVCTTSSFPKLNGAIVQAINNASGKHIQSECTNRYTNYPKSGVAKIDTAGKGQLKCKMVFIVVLKNYSKGSKEQSIYDWVFKCLDQAEKEQCTSIAFPTFGTGGFKYPADVSASETFLAIEEFFKTPKHNLKDVTIVLYGGDHNTCKVFHQEIGKISAFSAMAVPTSGGNSGGGGGGQQQQQQQPSVQVTPPKNVPTPSGQLKWQVPNAAITLEITYGNLALSQADVILNTTTSYPNLNGAIPSELCRVAGADLKQACARYSGPLTEGLVDETDGFKLNCEKVYHFVMPTWKQIAGEKMISDLVEDCLIKMKNSNLKSIAMPSIGTGGAKYNPLKVARGIYSAVQKFGADNPGVKCHVNVVLFPGATFVNDKFVDELQNFIGTPAANRPKSSKGVRFNNDDNKNEPVKTGFTYDDDDDDDKVIKIPRDRRDFVLFQITTIETRQAENAMKDIRGMIDREIKEVSTDKDIVDVTLLKGKNWKQVLEFSEGYRVKVTLDEKAKKIFVRGFGDEVMDCFQRILSFVHDLRKSKEDAKIGQIVYQHIEWYYTEDKGTIWVPYPKRLMYQLEDAYCKQQKKNELRFRDTDDKTYIADFNSLVEYEKSEKDQKSVKDKTFVKMMRKDFTEGALKSLPHHWETMDNGVTFKEVKIDNASQEFKDIETEFKKTQGSNAINIVEIRRIQNQYLFQQYQTMKEQLEAKRKTVANVEKNLWHATKEDVVNSINLNGFNRSYSGQTHGTVWYGHGVYFAVQTQYCLNDIRYSPADQNGIRRLYQVKVLTGLTTKVPQGYADRFAPDITGSHDRYDSTCDDANKPAEFVIFKDTQAYPEYLILFK